MDGRMDGWIDGWTDGWKDRMNTGFLKDIPQQSTYSAQCL